MTEVRAGQPEGDTEAPGALSDGALGAPIEAPSGRDAAAVAAAERIDQPDHKPTRVVAARVGLRTRLLSLWRSRELFGFLVRKEISVKYKNSVLGFMWSMLNPAFTLAVFFVLFTVFMPNGIPNFVIYMFSAMLLWNLFQTSVLSGTGTIVANAGIVKKVAFPREILALASVGSAFMFFVFQAIVMVVFMFAFWHRPLWSEMWLLLPALLAVALFASALSVFLAAVNVYLRDVQHLVEVALMAWFWAVPGIYAFSGRVHDQLARHHILWLYFLNALTPPVMTFQRVFYAQMHPRSTLYPHALVPNGVLARYPLHWFVLSDLTVIVVSALLLLGALVVFGRLEGNFAEEL